ncbi:hypothetical protein C0992_007654, partial [Termitomyces sp. T32_za158]
MDAPPSLDFGNMERIQQLYTELPSIFAKEIARRHHAAVPALGTLKRGASEELAAADTALKRRNTGDGARPSLTPTGSMPPPSTIPMAAPNQFPLPNGNGSGNGTPVSMSVAMSHPTPVPTPVPTPSASATTNPITNPN